jgi:hypothetical protein
MYVNYTLPPNWSNNTTSIPSTYSPTMPSQFNITWMSGAGVSQAFIEGNWSGTPTNYTTFTVGGSIRTFGLNTTGSTSYPTQALGYTTSQTGGTSGSGFLFGNRFQLTTSGTITSLSTYGSASGYVKVGIYSDSSSYPGTLLAGPTSGESCTGGSWCSHSLTYYATAAYYWLEADIDTSNAVTGLASSGMTRYYTSVSYSSSWPSTYPSSASSDSTESSFYATYVQVEGYAKCTKATLSDNNAVLSSVSFYANSTGDFRLAIYNDSSGPSSLLWQSGNTTVSGAPSWQTVNISSGTPTSLSLGSGTYWLCWQTDSVNSVPSYTAGSAGAGAYINLTYGNFPSAFTNGTGYVSTSETWSEYATYSTSNVYSYNMTMPAGTFYWKSYANDTSNNWNSTPQWTFTVAQAAPSLLVSFSPPTNVTYPTQTTASCGRVSGDPNSLLTFYRNGTQVAAGTSTPQSETATLVAGVYNYTCTINSTQNYTAATSLNNWLYVYSTPLVLTFSLNESTAWWNDPLNASGSFTSANGPVAGSTVSVNLSSQTRCTAVTDSNGNWWCTFIAPTYSGSYLYTAGSISLQASNSTPLIVAATYGAKPTGTASRGVVNVPMLMQFPDGTVRIVMVTVTVYQSVYQ